MRRAIARNRSAVLLSALLPLAGLAAACGGQGEPVATLTVGTGTVHLPYPERATLPVTFAPSAPLEGVAGQPRVFVHMLDAQGKVLRTFDHELPFDWKPGDEQSYDVELWQSAMAAPLDPGGYELTLGLYDGRGARWPLKTTGEEVDEGEYRVARVEVPPQPAPETLPQLAFPGAWKELERSGDRQVLVRRWLEDDGAVELTGLSEPLTVTMELRLPAEQEMTGQRLVLDEGASNPTVEITSSCTRAETRVSGTGSHLVEMTLEPPAGGEPCLVRLSPNFVYLDLQSFDKRAVSLETLTWNRPEGG